MNVSKVDNGLFRHGSSSQHKTLPHSILVLTLGGSEWTVEIGGSMSNLKPHDCVNEPLNEVSKDNK